MVKESVLAILHGVDRDLRIISTLSNLANLKLMEVDQNHDDDTVYYLTVEIEEAVRRARVKLIEAMVASIASLIRRGSEKNQG